MSYHWPTHSRIAPQTSCASSGVATLPVPMAQTGSYATTTEAICSKVILARASSTCAMVKATWSISSRTSMPSPTQTIGISPRSTAFLALALTRASSSP